MDAITNAISDSCEPRIVPDVTLQTVNDKTVIVVEIAPGPMRPYYLKSRGIVEGTYTRVSGTTRPVADYMLKELILEGQNRYYDCEPCDGLTVTSEAIDQLCKSLKETAMRNTVSETEKAKIRDITPNVLLSWGVLTDKDGHLVPTNAYALLTGQARWQPVIQCAVFKGKDRAYFLDRWEFEGSIQEQMDAAFEYVLEKINRGMRIQGMYRQDVYELPVDSVRELIANSVAHRSYLDPGNIQVALYDDRLEVTSPGMLLNGVSIKRMMEGYSKIRNRAIANAFAYMKIIERWGSGIPRIIQECREYGLPEPEFIDFDGDFRVNMYRASRVKNVAEDSEQYVTTQTYGKVASKTTGKTNQKTTGKTTEKATRKTTGKNIGKTTDKTISELSIELTKTEEKILLAVQNNKNITQSELAKDIGLSIDGIRYAIKQLKTKELLIREGSRKKGQWIVLFPKE